MRCNLYFCIASIICLSSLFIAGCSGHASPVTAATELKTTCKEADAGLCHRLWGIWQIHVDQGASKATPVPLRNSRVHFDVTEWLLPPECDDCIEISVNSFDTDTRILDVDVTLRNPTPLKGKDVRGILYTNQYGHELCNADDWTGLYDIPGGDDINPFKAFAKAEAYRMFDADAEHTENYLLHIPKPPHWDGITFAVTASWPGNAKEPYEIADFWQDPIEDYAGASGNIGVTVKDWQDDVDSVLLSAPEITGEQSTYFAPDYGNNWKLELVNNTGAAEGSYRGLIAAESAGSGSVALYDFVDIFITNSHQFELVDITPPWLNFSPRQISIDSNYAYVGALNNGLHIFNISIPDEPVWINRIEVPTTVTGVAISDGCACVSHAGGYFGGLSLIDVNVPESAFVISTIDIEATCYDVAASDGYAYIAAANKGLQIVDIEPPGSAAVIKEVHIENYAICAAVSGQYAYVLNGWCDIIIVDISAPESAYIAGTADLPHGEPSSLTLSGGYAYAAAGPYGVYIADVDPPGSAELVAAVSTPSIASWVCVSGGYAYVADDFSGLHIIDIDPPESASIVNDVEMPGVAKCVDASGNYGYVGDACTGIVVVDIEYPLSTYITDIVHTPGHVTGVVVDDEYAYTTNAYGGFLIVDINPPESSTALSWVDTYDCGDVAVQDDYAYVADFAGGWCIIDISSPESPWLVNTISAAGDARGVAASPGYAYVVGGSACRIYDVSTPADANEISMIPLAGAWEVETSAGYAYVGSQAPYLHIIDIDPPDSAEKVLSVTLPYTAWGVAIANGYAYVADTLALQIIDISEPETAFVVNEVLGMYQAMGVVVSGDLAYIADYNSGLYVVDIDPPEQAYTVKQCDTPGLPQDVAVNGDYIYVADSHGGLRIIKKV